MGIIILIFMRQECFDYVSLSHTELIDRNFQFSRLSSPVNTPPSLGSLLLHSCSFLQKLKMFCVNGRNPINLSKLSSAVVFLLLTKGFISSFDSFSSCYQYVKTFWTICMMMSIWISSFDTSLGDSLCLCYSLIWTIYLCFLKLKSRNANLLSLALSDTK